VFMTARVSDPVYITKPTADPAARTVLDQSIFSTVSGETLGGRGCRGTELESSAEGASGLLMVKVPINVCMSLIGASAIVAMSSVRITRRNARTIDLRI